MPLPTKPQWRQTILDARSDLSEAIRHAETSALITHVASLIERGSTVCAYVPTRTEPGSTELLDALAERAVRVLLPITGDPGPLSWVEYTGAAALRPAKYGLREPTGPVLPPSTVGLAETILVPALAVDRSGTRLGRGAGFYDRTLGAVAPEARLVAVVRDDELVNQLPADEHDIPMGWALTPTSGVTRLNRDAGREQKPD
ncbi:5-formyltetrahydrofolate cyclo-ligase [Rhodococcus sp. 27YEA15]|uniref:5-formyltetrahydrofolate cyclo-ligase n=1 Tax=Rhodococcus sp. 27YEA15 TaxID=3156259 RepID=UPI003C7AD867